MTWKLVSYIMTHTYSLFYSVLVHQFNILMVHGIPYIMLDLASDRWCSQLGLEMEALLVMKI